MSFTTESPENFEQKCCLALVVDVSSSMAGHPIQQLNNGLRDFYDDISNESTTANRLEVALVEFCDKVTTLIDPTLVQNFTMPELSTKGTTALVDGVREGMNIIRSRKTWYKQTGQPYYRPWIVLITDGIPDSNQDVQGLIQEIRQGVAAKEFFFFALGVEGANMSFLNSISDPVMPPAKLDGLKFSEFFKWLSRSMGSITSSKDGDKINLPSPASWMTGFTV